MPGQLGRACSLAAPIGPAADLYALGCVDHFLLTGRRVFCELRARQEAPPSTAAPT